MDKSFPAGIWLLIDAAGPKNLIGLVRQGEWLGCSIEQGDFLAILQSTSNQLLNEADLQLEDLAGTFYASGPGSTLGLRLAAMFIRSFMEMPMLSHWKCLQFQNLELALSSIMDGNSKEAVAPWRRDRFHHACLESLSPFTFTHSFLSPAEAEKRQLPGIELGRRPPAFANSINWQPYPGSAIPTLLAANPDLLKPVGAPLPYTAEEPEFARWSPQRHTKP